MKNKTVLITGANSGIGKVAASTLAQKGAHIIMLCRNAQKSEAALKDIVAKSGSNKVDLVLCDLSSQKQIKTAAEQINDRYDRLDVLLNNAGLIMDERKLTHDGLEYTFGVNHIGHFLLTKLLLANIQQTPNSRIVNVSSEAHRMGKLDFDNLQAEKKFSKWKVYGLSKLANILFTFELHRRLQGSDTTANCLHPGVVGTNFGKDAGKFLGTLIGLARPFLLTPAQGAQTSIYLASAPEVHDISGKYFIKCKPRRASGIAYDVTAAQKLWDLSEGLCRA